MKMTFEINAAKTIDNLINAFNEIASYNPKAVREARRKEDGKNTIDWLERNSHTGQYQFSVIADMLNCHVTDLEKATRAAIKWYNRTNWELCLSEKTAQKLILAAITDKF
jgi:hypothetical protein